MWRTTVPSAPAKDRNRKLTSVAIQSYGGVGSVGIISSSISVFDQSGQLQ
ncbi:MAG: hypothetical protein M3Z87_09500 [Lactobacillus sp.]|nr:hypothetical protein [Lactobacillus sp.]